VKIVMVSLIVWLFVVPCAVAIFLILTFLAAFAPNLYFILTWLAVGFATLAMMWGPFCFLESSQGSSTLFSGNQQHSTSFQEKHDEKYLEGHLGS